MENIENNIEENNEKNENLEWKNDEVSLSKQEYEGLLKDRKAYHSSTKEAQRLNAIAQVAKDNKNFFKVFRSDKKLAEEVAKHFWYEDASALKESLTEHYGADAVPDISEKEIKTTTSAIVDEKLAKQSLKSFVSGKKMGKDLEKEFMEEFEDLVWDRTLDEELVNKFTKKAWTIVKTQSKLYKEWREKNEELQGAGIIGAGSRGTTKTVSKKKEPVRLQDMYKRT